MLTDGEPELLHPRLTEPTHSDPSTTPRVLTILSYVLEKLVARNDRLSGSAAADGKSLSTFHGVRAPTISLEKYVERMYKYTSYSPSCFVVAFVYIDQFVHKYPDSLVVSLNVHRLLVTSVMVTSKILDDTISNDSGLEDFSDKDYNMEKDNESESDDALFEKYDTSQLGYEKCKLYGPKVKKSNTEGFGRTTDLGERFGIGKRSHQETEPTGADETPTGDEIEVGRTKIVGSSVNFGSSSFKAPRLTMLPPVPVSQEPLSGVLDDEIPTQHSQNMAKSMVPGPSNWDQLHQAKRHGGVQIGRPTEEGRKFIHLSTLQKMATGKKGKMMFC
ncbi:hypothetical protein ACS0TY_017582 [Phlomoides rotata]